MLLFRLKSDVTFTFHAIGLKNFIEASLVKVLASLFFGEKICRYSCNDDIAVCHIAANNEQNTMLFDINARGMDD